MQLGLIRCRNKDKLQQIREYSYRMDDSFEQSQDYDEEIGEDDLELFNNDDTKKRWKELFSQQNNEFYSNDRQELQGQLERESRNPKKKDKKEKQMSKEREHLRAYHYLIKLWTIKEILQTASRMQAVGERMALYQGELLSRMGIQNAKKLMAARGKSLDSIVGAVREVLGLSFIRQEPNMLERVMCLFKLCEIETRLLTLSNLQRFNLFARYKIHSKPYNKTRNQIIKGNDLKEYIKRVDREARLAEEAEEEDEELEDLDRYTYSSKRVNEETADKSDKSQGKRFNYKFATKENIFLKQFEWVQLYSPREKRWRIFSLQKLCLITDEDVRSQLEGVASVFIFSCKVLKVKPQYENLFQKRPLLQVELMDQTEIFCDNLIKIRKRRYALDLKKLIDKFSDYGKYEGPQMFLEAVEIACRDSAVKAIEEAISVRFFPKTLYDFRVNDWFVIPSQLGKFQNIRREVEPLEGLEFDGEKVYRRSDIDHLHSRHGWVDLNRMVKDIEIPNPRKQTLTRKNKDLKLFSYDQTLPFKWQIHNNKFDKDEYGSFYVNPYTPTPPGICIIPQRVAHVCKKNNFEYCQIIEGFNNHGPNVLGYAIFEKDKEEVLRLHAERLLYLEQKKEENKEKGLTETWRKLFKSILVTETVKQRYANAVN